MDGLVVCEARNYQSSVVGILREILNVDREFKPSEYYSQMGMSVEQRLEHLYKTRKNRVLVNGPFLATPDLVIFQNFEFGKSYSATLTLQNKEQCSKCIKVIFEQSVHFHLLYPPKVIWTKIAPGMTYQTIISFTGDELKDYFHQITFVTEEEQITIPIYALGPRPLIDIPDKIILPNALVNNCSEKTIIVNNNGKVSAAFSLFSKNPDIKLSPKKIKLEASEKTFIRISLQTFKKGTIEDTIFVKFDDEILLQIPIQCHTITSIVNFSKNHINFMDTFFGLQRQIPLTIEYHGTDFGYFKWKKYRNTEEETTRKLQLKEAFEEIKEMETKKSKRLTRFNIIDQDCHGRVYQRIFNDELDSVEETEEFFFQTPGFTIIPLSGTMGPNSLLEFTVIFSPTLPDDYEALAYLEISGREDRVPLKLKGKGLGPEFKINTAHIEANNVFLRSFHEYEIIVTNTGLIPGSLSFIPRELDFGGKIDCEPKTLFINVDHYAAFTVIFVPGEEGKFIEKIEFLVNESDEKLHFILTGKVIAPLLTLEIPEINFGIVPLGYPQEKEITLYNPSPVPIEYKISILDDGTEAPIGSDGFLDDVPFPRSAKEFHFEPIAGVVDGESKIIGMLSVVPNEKRNLETKFVVHMWGSKNYSISVPLKYHCRVAEIISIPPKIDIKFCFINYLYDRKIILQNRSNLPCHFKFVPIESDELEILSTNNQTTCIKKNDSLMVEVTVPKNKILPLQEVKIPLKIETSKIGLQEIPLSFDIFGNGPETLCKIICNGQGPAICFLPAHLNFQTVTLLKTITKKLQIINDTPIPAKINFSFRKPGSFDVAEMVKQISPASKDEIDVAIFLTDPGRHSNTLIATVENGPQINVNLTAFGEGTSISCDPVLEPKLDLGTLLTYKKFSFPLIFRNRGSRWHKLWISRSDNLKTVKESLDSSAGVSSVFRMSQHYFALMTNESIEIQILASKKQEGYVCEQFFCHAVIEKSHDRHIIFVFEIVAKFADPYVSLSRSGLEFCLDVSSDGVFAKLKDVVKFRNDSGLCLEVDVSVHPPFFLVVDGEAMNQRFLRLNNLSNRKVQVEFHPPPHEKKCVVFQQTLFVNYRDHPKVDSIPVKAIINYPTLSITPQTINFECVPLGSSNYRTMIIKNTSSVPVVYKWVFIEDLLEQTFEPIQPSPKDPEPQPAPAPTDPSCSIDEKLVEMLNSLLETPKKDTPKQENLFLQKSLPHANSKPKISQIFDIIPHEGCLEPYEQIRTYVKLTPNPNTEITATAFCHIIGGANEPVQLKAKCKKISYYLPKPFVNCNKVNFYDTSENDFEIVNDGDGKFSFKVTETKMGLLKIEPSTGTIAPGENMIISVKCFPCDGGRFETNFQLEIDYLETITIPVFGFSCFPQIYIDLPRPTFDLFSPWIQYSAIADLSDLDFFCNCPRDYFPDVDRQILEANGWIVILLTDHFPCTMIINMSMEIIWAKMEQKKDTEILYKLLEKEKYWPIPNFIVAPYILNIGYVQIETKNSFAINFLNYGPGKTIIKTQTNHSFSKNGFDCAHIRHMMDLNRTYTIHFNFTPTIQQYPELNTKVLEFIYIDLRNGPRVPIQIEAIVVTPDLQISSEEIDFGSVRCGDCLRQTLNLINKSCLTCKWTANIEEIFTTSKSKQKTSFFILSKSGTLEPGDKFYLRIYFEPNCDDFLSATLTIKVDGNFRHHEIHLIGFGMEPFLEITDEKIVFDTNIPYSDDNEKLVTIRNVSKCPVEFFFIDYDSKLLQEDFLVRSYIIGNVLSKTYIDYRSPGEDLPEMFQDFYDKVLEELETRLARATDSKQSTTSTRRDSRQSSFSSGQLKLGKLGGSLLDTQNIITNYLLRKQKRLTKTHPMQEFAVTELRLPDTDSYPKHSAPKGTLLVFHGPPMTKYIKAAHNCGKLLKLPVYTIDRLIMDCLLRNASDSAKEINDKLQTAFEKVAEDLELETSLQEDCHDVLLKKIRILLEGRKPIKKKKDSAKSKKSKTSSKKSSKSSKSTKKSSKSSKSGKKKKITDTLINLPSHLFSELLEEELRENPAGLIIENLQSNFLRKPLIALNAILQLSKSVDSLFFVIFTCTFDEFLSQKTKKEEKKQAEILQHFDSIGLQIDTMTAKDFEDLRKLHPEVYRNYIKERKDEFLKRRGFKSLKSEETKSREKVSERKPKSEKSSKSSQKTKKSKGSSSKKSSKKSSKLSSKKGKRILTPDEMEAKSQIQSFSSSFGEMMEILSSWNKANPFQASSSAKLTKSNKTNRSTKSSKKSFLSSSEIPQTSDLGVPCWILTKTLSNKFENLVPKWLQQTIEAQTSFQIQTKNDFSEPSSLKTVLVKPKSRVTKCSSVFKIKDFQEKSDSVFWGSKLSLRKKNMKNKSFQGSTNALSDLETTENFTYRKLLFPGDSIKYRIHFVPTSIGNYKHIFEIGVVGWTTKFHITCLASCDIPRITMNPEILFNRVIEQRTSRYKNYHCTFVNKNRNFEFGGVLLGFEEMAQFHLNNISRMNCEVIIATKKDTPIYSFEPKNFTIAPRGKSDLTMIACPLKEEMYKDSLMISVKNNPKTEEIKLLCLGCDIAIDVNPKHVVFERVTLEVSLKKDITITNNTPREVHWTFVNYEQLLENFKFSHCAGIISAFSCGIASVYFTASDIRISSSTFQVEIYDKNDRLLYESDVKVTAETTALEFFYENEINFGDVKGWKSHSKLLHITTKGRYEILAQIVSICDRASESKYFTINPTDGKLQPNSTLIFELKFAPDKLMTVEKLPIYACNLVDPFHQVIIKTFDIFVSAKVFLSKFEMCPFPEIYFGYQTVGLEKVMTFRLINRGKFDFNYQILKEVKMSDQKKKQKTKSKSPKSSKGSSKKTRSDKGSKKSGSKNSSAKRKLKLKETTLNLGIFSLISSTGLIEPNAETSIVVKSKPLEAGDFSETVIVHVSEPALSDQKGKKLRIHVTACEPQVNFNDLSNIFKEQLFVEKIDDLYNITSKVIFSKSEMKMKFQRVCVNTSETTRVRIQNVGLVSAHVTAKLGSNQVFQLNPVALSIDPYQTEIVSIEFSPTSLEEHKTTITFECRGFRVVEKLTFDVIGEACVPEVGVLEPVPEEDYFCAVKFGPTLLGRCVSKNFSFQNRGVLACKAIVEVCFDEFDQIMLVPAASTIPLLNFWNPETPMRHTNLVNLECEQVAQFEIRFQPAQIGVWKAEIKIYTVNNPFETKTIHIFCEGYYLDVILEGLESYSVSNESSPTIGYSLNFGHISLNTLERRSFLIKNISEKDTYKFEFPYYNEVIFSPTIGHLRPKSNKHILAVFLSKSSVEFYETKIECKLHKIEYEEYAPHLSWDDRQYYVTWCDDSSIAPKTKTELVCENNGNFMKKVEENPEPKYKIIPNASSNLVILLSGVAGYATFKCKENLIEIPDTFVMDKKSVSFEVKNTGKVALKMVWSMSVKDLPRRINSCSNLSDFDFGHCNPKALTGQENFMFGNETKRSSSASTLFSTEAEESNRSSDTWSDNTSLPFSVVPEKVTIEPNTRQKFTINFTPNDVFEYTVFLKSSTENKHPDLQELNLEIRARSILPLYCFELDESDYVENRRRGRKMCNDLYDHTTKIVEFESIGLGTICTKKFYLKNPTSKDFFYTWQPSKILATNISPFHCHTSNGSVLKGKTVEIVFSFISQEAGIFEEFYFFTIPLNGIKVSFLLVGIAREPRIHFDKSHIDVKPTIIGIEVEEEVFLKNEENDRFKFKFEKLSMLCEGVAIEPMQGVLDPFESFPIKIVYKPKKKIFVSYDLKCFVEKMTKALELHLSCTCFQIEASLQFLDRHGRPNELVRNQLNVINLGAMIPHQKYEVVFDITNVGRIDFRFLWDLRINKISGLFDINVGDNNEIVGPNETFRTKLTLIPLIKCQMQPHRIYIKIPNGPCYHFQLAGSAGRPPFKFSFLEYNFGNCLLQTSPTKFYKTFLKITNFNIFPLTIEQGKHDAHISTDFQSCEIQPQETKTLTIFFHPLILGDHILELPFYVDGKKLHVTISGKAVSLKLGFVDQSDKFVDFGPVLVGKTCTKSVKIINESECEVSFVVNFLEKLPKRLVDETPSTSIEMPKEAPKISVKKKTEKKKKKESKSSKSSTKSTKSKKSKSTKSKSSTKSSTKKKKTKKEQVEIPKIVEVVPKKGTDFITITPEKLVKIRPQRIADITITFSPKEKIEPFIEKIFYRVQHYTDAFFILKGSTMAPSISLDRNHVTFGNVVVNFERKMFVVLRNTGDIPLKFKWVPERHEENFSIVPTKGYILACTDLAFNIFFRPKMVKCWIKSKITCEVPSINKKLHLTLSGSCVNVPPATGTIEFICPVREKDTKILTISNPSNKIWEITPQISDSTSFKTIEILRIPAKKEDSIEIIFSPMALKEHNVTLCVPTPDGIITSYNLKGTVVPPNPLGHITREVLCKAQHLEKLPIENWLMVKQQFVVTTTINGTISTKNLFSISGNSLIEVPPNGTRTYDWLITPINEGPLDLKVTFTNKTTKEYCFYEISLKVLPNKQLELIDFITCARNSITRTIKLENPLNVPVTYQMSCAKNLEFEQTVILAPHSLKQLEITYKPLVQEEEMRIFEASCAEMGTFSYNLNLVSHAPVPEPCIVFKAYLGQGMTQKVDVVQTRTCRFSFEDNIFYLNNVISDSSLSVTFEPNEIGRFQRQLLLQSPYLGDFLYPLVGECFAPKPQGPFFVAFASPIVISFKNPFSSERLFNFRTEPCDFLVKQQSEVIGAKKVLKIGVSLVSDRGGSEAKYPITGKLEVSCSNPQICWVYYLQEIINK